MVIKLSYSSKMKINKTKVPSFDLQARTSCPGSKLSDDSIVEVCQKCYALKGSFRWPVVKAVRASNKIDYHRDEWVEEMIVAIRNNEYFRWFSSGDCESSELANKILEVIRGTPKTSHWFVTRSDKVQSIRKVYTQIDVLNNVSIRISADHIGLNNIEREGVNSYVINEEDLFEAKRQGIFVCPVSLPGSAQKSCDTCTHCYGHEKVAYVLH